MRNLLRSASAFCNSSSVNDAVLIFAVAVLFFASYPTPLYSQAVSTGTISGQVTDPTGSAVSDATVTLTDNATSLSRTTTTNGEGQYVFVNVPPGVYTLTVNKTGFRVSKIATQEVKVGLTSTVNTNT